MRRKDGAMKTPPQRSGRFVRLAEADRASVSFAIDGRPARAPAGVRAAEVLVAAGVRPIVIDEGRRDGGQIYRRQPENFARPPGVLYGTEAWRALDLHRSFEALRERIDYRPETLAWNVVDNHV